MVGSGGGVVESRSAQESCEKGLEAFGRPCGTQIPGGIRGGLHGVVHMWAIRNAVEVPPLWHLLRYLSTQGIQPAETCVYHR